MNTTWKKRWTIISVVFEMIMSWLLLFFGTAGNIWMWLNLDHTYFNICGNLALTVLLTFGWAEQIWIFFGKDKE